MEIELIQHSKLNLKEYLQEEIRVLPRQQEMQSFVKLTEDVVQETKSLESRIKKLIN